MRIRGVQTRSLPRSRGILLAAGLLFTISVPEALPDALGFLPSKEAQWARQVLTRLDASLEAWNSLESRYAEAVRQARTASAGPGDVETIRTLLASGAEGAWNGGAGPGLARIRADALNQAKLLESILEPRLDRLDPGALSGLFRELESRARRVPGSVPAYLEFAEHAAAAGASGMRFALRALLSLAPEPMSLRLAPDDGAGLAYGGPPELADEAARIRTLRRALEEFRRAAPALGVPELPWTEAEGEAAGRAARALSLLDPEILSGLPESSAIPGFRLLPAFLAGLSPEERALWARDRGISPQAAEAFLRCAPGAFGSEDPGSSGSGASMAVSIALAELEREIASGSEGIDLLFLMTDPALRLALRSEEAPRSIRAALSGARDRLAADLESSLSRNSAGLGHRVEIEEAPGLSGFAEIRAAAVSPDGVRSYLPPSAVRSALGGLLAEVSGKPGASYSGLELGLIAGSLPRPSGGDTLSPDASIPLEAFDSAEALSPSAIAALSVYVQGLFREAVRATGVAPAYLMPPALGFLTGVCEARCLGTVDDAAVEGALARAGGKSRVRALWEVAFLSLEAVRRSITVYRDGEGTR